MANDDDIKLPDHFGNNSASYCASQLTNISILTPTMYVAKWRTRPGFLDPFEVVYMCVRRLRQETYCRVRYHRRCDERVADKSQLCPGLQVYFNELRPDSRVQKDLAEHISRGSVSHLKYVLSKYRLDQTLLFLLKYIRERGPLLRIQYTSLSTLQRSCSRSSSLAIAFLTSGYQHEFEYESMVAIGSYLNYLLTVACAHDLFWVQGFLSELWGPLLIDFVNIGSQRSETMTEEQLTERRVCFMSRLLDSMPWDSLKRSESLRLTLGPDQDQQDLMRYSVEADRHVAQLQERPTCFPNPLMANASKICALLDGQLPDVNAPPSSVNEQYLEAMREKLFRDALQRQEEKIREELEADNRDYSDQYLYSEKFRAMHAPYGMCKTGV